MNKVREYTKEGYKFISIRTGEMKIILCSLGASIYEIYYDNKLMNMSPETLNNFTKENEYFGRTIGRVANRIPQGIAKIYRKEIQVETNENGNTLHGGYDNISNKTFNYEIENIKEYTRVTFSVVSHHKEAGFPGNMIIRVSYFVSKNSVEILYWAVSDRITLCALTNHTYYTLGSKFEDLFLAINSSKYVYPNPDDLLPVEEREVPDYLDFRGSKNVSLYVDSEELLKSKANGIDHDFIFETKDVNNPQLILENYNYKMTVYTSFDSVQVYTDNYENKIKYKGLNGKRRRGIAIEPQDCLLNPRIIKDNTDYKRYIKLVFEKKQN